MSHDDIAVEGGSAPVAATAATLGIDDLPVFGESPFDPKTDVSVFEVAKITMKMAPGTTYNRQRRAYVVGRTPDATEIFLSGEAMVRGGDVFAMQGPYTGSLGVDLIQKYEIVAPDDMSIKGRRI